MSETPKRPNAESGKSAGTEVPELGRGLPAVQGTFSLQRRASRILAATLLISVVAALLAWYYSHVWKRPVPAARRGAAAAVNRDAPLPALQPIRLAAAPASTDASVSDAGTSALPLGTLAAKPARSPAATGAGTRSAGLRDHRLGGAAFTEDRAATRSASGSAGPETNLAGLTAALQGATASAPSNSFSRQLITPMTDAVRARRLPTRQLLLPRGATIDCTLITAVDSSLAGLVTCLTATDTFSADGRVVLLERGTSLVGETRGEVRAGLARVFIVWTEARTPSGVVAALDSPATDAMGRSGVGGAVQRHFWERFGAAMLLSVVDGVVQSEASGGNAVVVSSGNSSSQILGEVLKDTIGIPPTVTIAAGTEVHALVARDIDFRTVYELRLTDPAS